MSKNSKWFSPALGRPLVWSDTHNRIIALFALAAFPLAFFWKYFTEPSGLWDIIWVSAGAPVTVFITWAIGREGDPARPWSALIAAFVSLISWGLFNNPDFMLLLVALMSLRVINRSTGKRATLPESAFILFLTAWLTWSGSVYAGAIVGLAFWLDARLPDRRLSHYLFALMALITGVAASLVTRDISVYPKELQLYFIAVVTLLSIPTILYYLKERVIADNGMEVPRSRVLAAVGLLWLFLSCNAFMSPNIGLNDTYPFLMVFICMGILNTVSGRSMKN
ncbi:hypothetical protein AB9P05_07435 [Roseivirga sp. BDSF3-8]|uniref:hypothetical protein n=1 Tax=Roseivirga sp. BDSF3-8 TaxID=3241598 RepID=UPI0035324DA5